LRCVCESDPRPCRQAEVLRAQSEPLRLWRLACLAVARRRAAFECCLRVCRADTRDVAQGSQTDPERACQRARYLMREKEVRTERSAMEGLNTPARRCYSRRRACRFQRRHPRTRPYSRARGPSSRSRERRGEARGAPRPRRRQRNVPFREGAARQKRVRENRQIAASRVARADPEQKLRTLARKISSRPSRTTETCQGDSLTRLNSLGEGRIISKTKALAEER